MIYFHRHLCQSALTSQVSVLPKTYTGLALKMHKKYGGLHFTKGSLQQGFNRSLWFGGTFPKNIEIGEKRHLDNLQKYMHMTKIM